MNNSHPSPRRERVVKRLALAATIGMFIVLMMGSTVTNTGSGEGCGRSWPLCHGKFIPEYAVETAIEFSHRIVTAIEGLLIAAAALGAILIRRGDREIKILVAVMVGTLIIQSGMGAAAVMWPQTPTVMALHFGISMTCFAAVFLLTRKLYETPGEIHLNTITAQSKPLPVWFKWGTWGVLVGSIIVAYVGAYMRHSGNELACHTWPDCNGQIFPGFTGTEGIAFSHRFLAAALMVMVAALAYRAYVMRADYPGLYRVNALALALIIAQALVGGAVVLSRLDLWTTLAHAAFMAWLFVFITDACRQVLKTQRVPATTPAVLSPATGLPSGD